MGGRDQSQVKNKSLKSSKKGKSVPKDVPKSHNNDMVILDVTIEKRHARPQHREILGLEGLVWVKEC